MKKIKEVHLTAVLPNSVIRRVFTSANYMNPVNEAIEYLAKLYDAHTFTIRKVYSE